MVEDFSRLEVNAYGEVLHFSVSIGVAEMSSSDQSGNDLLRRAEQGLKDAIEQGREQAIFATPPVQLPETESAAAD
jgi:PleD family two-component response regulator|tara:strand:+ start:3148 stop:3375 length:228 start_codon:yes stop_codon:yes gene_type:complete